MGRDIRAKMRFSPEVTFMRNERVLLRVAKVFGIPRENARELGSNIWGGTGNGNKIRNYVAEWSEANTPVQRRAEQG